MAKVATLRRLAREASELASRVEAEETMKRNAERAAALAEEK
jgi:hypothetical protein